MTTEVPALRIIDDALWQAVNARQQKMRRALSEAGYLGRAKRAVYLFSGADAVRLLRQWLRDV